LAQAQVATTDLLPGTASIPHPNAVGISTLTFTPDNPAALGFAQSSAVGVGMMNGTLTDNLANTSQDYEATYLGVRFVSDIFSLAADTVNMKDPDGLGIVEEKDTDVQLAVKLGDALSIGGGMSDLADGNNTIERLTLGVSFNLAEVFYLGAAVFQDDMDFAGTIAEREGTMYGLAYRSDGDWKWYLAYDVFKLGEIFISGVGIGNETNISKATFQVNAGNLFLGAATFEVDFPGNTGEVSGTIIDVGWVPEEGLSITARLLELTDVDPAGPSDDLNENTSVTVAWLF
jgi:hypothetical protein